MFYRPLFVFLYFFFGDCIVCLSSIYGFWSPLWYLVAIVLSVILLFTFSDYPCGILWPLCCLSFFYLRFLIIPVVYCGHCVVCPSSIYGFWLLLWYLVAIVLSVIRLFTVHAYSCGILRPLYCLSFVSLWFLITPVIFCGHCVLITPVVSCGHCVLITPVVSSVVSYIMHIYVILLVISLHLEFDIVDLKSWQELVLFCLPSIMAFITFVLLLIVIINYRFIFYCQLVITAILFEHKLCRVFEFRYRLQVLSFQAPTRGRSFTHHFGITWQNFLCR